MDFQAMGTTFFCILVGGDETIYDLLYERVNELEQKWSRFIPDSELLALNNNPDSDVKVSKFTLKLISEMKNGYELTGGLYDANVLAHLLSSGFGTSRTDSSKSTDWKAKTSTTSNISEVQLDLQAMTVLIPKGVALDSGGIGKGLAADLICDYALELGAMGAAVFAGGDVSVKGMAPQANGWNISISDPTDSDKFIGSVLLSRGGLATSSPLGWNLENSHHIIDPRTGISSNSNVLQATVITQKAVQAEVLSKMCVILNAPEAIARIDSLGAAALIVDIENQIHTSQNWENFSC